MSSLFSSTQPASGANNSSLFGMPSNSLSTGLNTQQQFQNSQINSLQHRPVIDSRFTIRQLTTIIPEWRGHFDIADAIMSSQELMLTNVSIMVSQLNTVFDQFKKTFELTRSSLNDISMQQNSLNEEVQQRLKYQDTQNLVTIKSRRLCEMLINSQATTDKFSIRVPNHINVQLTRELYEKVKAFKSEIDYMQNEVQMLKQIDLLQVPNFVDSVLQSHANRIMTLSDKLMNQLNAVDYRTNTAATTARLAGSSDAPGDDPNRRFQPELDKFGYSLRKRLRLWSGLSDEPSSLRRKFMEAVGVQVNRKESEESQLTDVKLQIRYLRKFNSSYDDPQFPYLRDYGFNIKDLLTSTPQNRSLAMQSGGTTGLFGTGTGSTNLFGSTGSNTGNLFGSTTGTGLFGSSNTGTSTGTGNLFGSTQSSTGQFGSSRTGFGTSSLTGQTQSSTTGGLFGNTSTTGFGSSAGTGTGLFGSGSSTTNTGTGLFGSTNNTGTTASTGLFGNTNTGSNTGLFGSTSTATPTFGSNTTTTSGTGIFGSTNTANTGSGLFGGSTTSGFGSNTGGFGSNTGGFGTNTGSTGLFGSSNTSGFGSNTTNTSSGLFGSSTNTGFGNTNTGSTIFGSGTASSSSLFGSNQQKSTGTELAIYQPTTSFSNFNRK